MVVLPAHPGLGARRHGPALRVVPGAAVHPGIHRDGVPLWAWGEYGQDPWSVTGPAGLALDGAGRLFIAEAEIHNPSQTGLQVFTPGGVYLESWGRFSYEGGPGDLITPYGLAWGPDDCLYVSDAEQSRLLVFSTDGTYLRDWTTRGYGVAIDAAGDVFVAGSDDDRIRHFTNTGDLVKEWGTTGPGPGQFNQPHDVALDAAGNVYVADTYNHRIQVFTRDGTYVTEWGGFGNEPGQFYRPMAVLVDPEGVVYVGDTWNGRVQKFGAVATGTTAPSWGDLKRRYR